MSPKDRDPTKDGPRKNEQGAVPTHPPARRTLGRPWWRLIFQWQTLALALILIGALVIALYSMRSLRSYREFQHIRGAELDRGLARLDAIRPWMTVRYVGVAYAVPEEYIFAQLEIPYNRRNSNATLGQLNQDYAMGQATDAEFPAIIDRVAQAIVDYRANPVPPGLRELRPWMTLRYIAASTGVPQAYLVEALGLDAAHAAELDAAIRPLDQLAHEMRYPGGPEAMLSQLRQALDSYEASTP